MRISTPAIHALGSLVLAVAFVIAGCSDTETIRFPVPTPTPSRIVPMGGSQGGGLGGGGGGGDGGGFGAGSIYVSSVTPGGRSILRFRVADTVNTTLSQDIPPAAQIQGPATQLRDLSPKLELVSSSDRLYVLDTGRVLVFDNASTRNGDSVPTRVIGLDNLIAPASIALDTSRDVLYVADFSANAIAVFTNASTLNATPTAARVISGGAGLDGPREIFAEIGANRLYVANSFSDSIASFDSVSTLDGSVDATRVLTGTVTQLSFPFGMATDAQGRLFVGNRGTGTITVYGAGASGNTAPLAVMDRPASGLAFPAQISIANGLNLVVADDLAFAVRTYFAPAVANNQGVQTKQITGSNTQLFFPFGLAVDSGR